MVTERARIPVWLITAGLGFATTLAGATVATAYRAGAIADGLEHLAVAVEKVDRRMVNVEAALSAQGNRITVLETRTGTVATSSASPRR